MLGEAVPGAEPMGKAAGREGLRGLESGSLYTGNMLRTAEAPFAAVTWQGLSVLVGKGHLRVQTPSLLRSE